MPLPDAIPSSPLSVLSEHQCLLDGTPVRAGAAAAQTRTSPLAHKRNLSQSTPPPQAATTPDKDEPSTFKTRDRQSIGKSLSPSVMRKVRGTERQTRSTRSASRAVPQQQSSPTPDITMDEDDQDEPPSPTIAAGRKRKASVSRASASGSAKKIVLAKKPRNGATAAARWSVPAIYASAKSPLVKVDLRGLLLHPKAWASLRPEQQDKLRAGFGLKPGEDMNALASDDSFRYDCARYTEAIENEQFSDEWLTEAWMAHERRKRGEFDEFLRGKLERDWGAVVPPTKRELQLNGELPEGRSSSASAGGETGNQDDMDDLAPPPKRDVRHKASLVDRGGGVEDGIAAMGPPRRAARQKASLDNRSIDPKSTEEERSRQASGTHSTASTVGETEFTELRLGLRPQEEKDTDQEMTDAGGGKGQVAAAAA